MEELKIEKLVHGGQGLADLSDGRKAFVWNALPGETVRIRVIKNKHSYVEAIAEEILIPSSQRVMPREDNFLSTSPWQIVDYAAENAYKSDIVHELYSRSGVQIADVGSTVHDDHQWNYRNKMEYSFWGDDEGLHLALHRRGSHGKQIVDGSVLAHACLDTGARAVLADLKDLNVRAGDLKTIIVRSSQNSEVVAALYTKLESFPKIDLPEQLKGLRVYYSNPKSPASVPTKLLYEVGNSTLEDKLLGKRFTYDVDSFFQVNLPIYQKALSRIQEYCLGDPIDMYAGVGSIGLSVAKERVSLVELDPTTAAMAQVNAAASSVDADVIEASTEKALEYITASRPVIFDPPRAGLHSRVVECCLEAKPMQIIYLSCNPATQARDLKLLVSEDSYEITFFEIYNFFPRTPHIETLAVLRLKEA
jgi:23S rRNA (uracil1939-C5)-methyltransferase